MDIYKNDKEYLFGKHKISLDPKESEIQPIIKEYEDKLKPKYSLFEHLSHRKGTKFTLAIIFFIFIPFLIGYSMNIITFENIEYAKSLGNSDIEKKINIPSYVGLFILIVLFTIEALYYFEFKSIRERKRKDVNDRILYFKNKVDEIRHKERYQTSENIYFRNVPDGMYFPEHHSKGLLESFQFLIILIIGLFIFVGSHYKHKEYNIEGTFNEIHYSNNRYVLFKKENDKIIKIELPKYINVEIRNSNENTYRARWVKSYFSPKDDSNGFNPNFTHYVVITLKDSEKINGSLMNYDKRSHR